ncbi:conserved hypothetical protein [Treponema phagedenis]|uniref:Uncharacterized protein n=1 Tax=Treponema phagedenis TaxID=162 RepID=A0A0B7GWW8_TREPH|nr:conserved hypothetical protein [Treponema phagedenis]
MLRSIFSLLLKRVRHAATVSKLTIGKAFFFTAIKDLDNLCTVAIQKFSHCISRELSVSAFILYHFVL